MAVITGTEGNDTGNYGRLRGSDGADVIYGLGGVDDLRGEGGNDRLYAGDGADQVFGGPGNDLIRGGDGDDAVVNGFGGLNGGEGNDTIYGDDGNDFLDGFGGDDRLYGGLGDDNLYGGYDGRNYLDGGPGNDTLTSGVGMDTLHGGDGNDYLVETEGNGFLYGEAGNDTLRATEVEIEPYLDGGDGIDLLMFGPTPPGLDFRGSRVFTFEVAQADGADDLLRISGVAEVELLDGDWLTVGEYSALFTNFELVEVWSQTYTMAEIYAMIPRDLTGDAGPDALEGGQADDTLSGLGGDDTLTGGAGADLMDGGTGSDVIEAGEGDDDLTGGEGSDTLRGGDGDDSLTGGGEDDLIDGGAGYDTVFLPGMNSGFVVSGTVDRLVIETVDGTDTLVDVELVDTGNGTYTPQYMVDNFLDIYTGLRTGTEGDDTIRGDALPDTIEGLGGNDALYGDINDDLLLGGDGDDLLMGEGSYDALAGGEGNDTLDGGTDWDTLNGNEGNDVLIGGPGGDVLIGGPGIDTASYVTARTSVRVDLQNDRFMYGDAVGDTFESIEVFRTGNTMDQLRGNSGDNTFYAGGFSDRLYGRAGDDWLFGEGGADALYGGLGADVMTGGGAEGLRDRFIYFAMSESGVGAGNRDIIADFVSGEDRIEISRFDADVTQGFKQAFAFVGEAGLSGVAGELAYVHEAGNTIVQADVDGDGAADFEIELTGIMDLTADDFLI